MDDSVGGNNAVWRRIGLNNFELHCAHTSTYEKYVTLVYGPVRLQKVWL